MCSTTQCLRMHMYGVSQHNSPQPPVSTREAAKATGSCPSFFYRHQHEIPGQYRVGRCLRWDVAAVREWMQRKAKGYGPDGV